MWALLPRFNTINDTSGLAHAIDYETLNVKCEIADERQRSEP